MGLVGKKGRNSVIPVSLDFYFIFHFLEYIFTCFDLLRFDVIPPTSILLRPPLSVGIYIIYEGA